jgi:phosphomethylpyrimidine synthase
MSSAKSNEQIADFKIIAKNEQVDIELVIEEVRTGRGVIIPNRGDGDPIIYGLHFRSKVLCNIGTSSKSPDISHEIDKANIAIGKGSSIICDQSVGEDIATKRKQLIKAVSIPIASVPLYQNVEQARTKNKNPLNFNSEDVIKTFEQQIIDGVSAPGIHSINLYMKEVVEKSNRLMPVVSRGSGILLQWMRTTGQENPYFEYFDEVVSICKKYNVPLTFVSGVRAGTVLDGFDECQSLEWQMLASYIEKAHSQDVSVVFDGLGHMSIDQIPVAVKEFKKTCLNIPMGALGPASSDRGLGHEHLVNAIGTAVAISSGVNYVNACYRTEHLGLPELEDIPEGISSSMIAVHVGDLAKKETKERMLIAEEKISKARKNNRWGEMLNCAIDREEAIKTYKRVGTNNKAGEGCTICGDLCPFVVTGQVEKTNKKMEQNGE